MSMCSGVFKGAWETYPLAPKARSRICCIHSARTPFVCEFRDNQEKVRLTNNESSFISIVIDNSRPGLDTKIRPLQYGAENALL